MCAMENIREFLCDDGVITKIAKPLSFISKRIFKKKKKIPPSLIIVNYYNTHIKLIDKYIHINENPFLIN